MDKSIDVVIPVFNEIEIVEQLHRRVVAACEQTGIRFRIVYVDDGGVDGTAEWLEENAVNQAGRLGAVTVLRLSRNFGHPQAISAGLDECDAEATILMDGDLQDPPELIPELVEHWQNGEEVVIPQKSTRKENFLRGLGFYLFHRIFQLLADDKIPSDTGSFCLMDRRAVEAIRGLPESHRFFPGLRAWIGFRQKLIPFKRPERAGGEPKQKFRRLFKYALDAIFSHSLKPLRFLTAIGGAICFCSFVLVLFFVAKRLIGWETASIGFTTLTCAVFCLGGFQLVAMGILGEYLGRIFSESKQRPAYLVSRRIDSRLVIRRSSEFEPEARKVA